MSLVDDTQPRARQGYNKQDPRSNVASVGWGTRPTGKSPRVWFPRRPALFAKYIVSRLPQIKPISRAVSSHQEGRLAIVTNAGRDAVDAKARSTMRSFSRTAKSCGPDASTLASSEREVSRWRR